MSYAVAPAARYPAVWLDRSDLPRMGGSLMLLARITADAGAAPPDVCHLWPYRRNTQGYAVVWCEAEYQRVNRIVCAHVHGPAPSAQHQAAHSCGERACVNPRHLRWATQAENIADAKVHGTFRPPPGGRINAAKTHCPNGHEYTAENLSTDLSRGRRCKACNRERMRLAANRKKELSHERA